jgi:hypothetical protein
MVTFSIGRQYIKDADPMLGIVNPRPYRPALPNAAGDAEIVKFLKVIDASNFAFSSRGVIELQLLTHASRRMPLFALVAGRRSQVAGRR